LASRFTGRNQEKYDMEEQQNPIQERMEDIVNQEFERQERETARDLLRDAYRILPPELKDLYAEVTQLHRQGKFEESSKLFEQWMDEARDMGLI
jgi:tetratricopeptide (TPR) repeat protein